jgi:hypothetical protein
MKDTILSNVETATHLGIQRSKTDKETIKNTVNENIKKARRTAHSLMFAGFHGNNGLDPSTSIHILKTYVIPTITYDFGDSNNQYISDKSYFHSSDFTSVNQLLLFLSLTASCRLAIFFSVESSGRRKMLCMNVSIFK